MKGILVKSSPALFVVNVLLMSAVHLNLLPNQDKGSL
jgi:hypothetical protein